MFWDLFLGGCFREGVLGGFSWGSGEGGWLFWGEFLGLFLEGGCFREVVLGGLF